MDRTVKLKFEKDTIIGVLAGGMSPEREISLRSGANCLTALKQLGYEKAVMIDVSENIAQELKDKKIEVAYNALHGEYGEDGAIQGLLEVMKIPYTGCGVASSAICMNKHYTKQMLKNFDIPLIKSVCVKKDDNIIEKTKELKYPLFLKPVTLGSSIGMYKVNNEKELVESYKKSLEHGVDVLIEEFITGIDATIGVLHDNGKLFATPVLQMAVKTGWYDYKAKYTKGMTEFIIPAKISDSLTKRAQNVAIESFKACGCFGLARVDFVITEDETYVLEINTSPGMTDLSDLPAQALSMGIDYDSLVGLILNSAGLNK